MSATVREPLRWRAFWMACGWGLTVLVVYLSLTPTPPSDPLRFYWHDKFEHALAYGALMGWYMQLYTARRARRTAALLLMALGVLLEILQGIGGSRSFDVFDMVANVLGVLLVNWALRPPLTDLFARIERYARG